MMKKISKIVLILAILAIALTAVSGCTFIDLSYKPNGNGGSSSGNYSTEGKNYGDSVSAADGVSIVVSDVEDREEMSFIDAVAKVERTAVMLTTGNSAGSGVLVNMQFEDDGASWKTDEDMVFILTCHHMVEGLGEIEITIPDENCSYSNNDYIFSGYIGNEEPAVYTERGYAVTLVGGDMTSDIALLKLDLDVAAKSGNKLSKDKLVMAAIPPKDAYSVKKGETVFSIGNPTGNLPGSVAKGIVSYLERQTSVSDIGTMTLMQIDVSTNPGNSGGGLYNLYGELIGITNAGNTSYTNINFAIPCYSSVGNGFVEIAEQLGGTATEDNYGYISGRRERFGFTVSGTTGKPVVQAVESGSLAAGCGMNVSDVITVVTLNGVSHEITTYSEFTEIFEGLKMQDKIVLTVKRKVRTGFMETEKTVQLNELTVTQYHFCNTGKGVQADAPAVDQEDPN